MLAVNQEHNSRGLSQKCNNRVQSGGRSLLGGVLFACHDGLCAAVGGFRRTPYGQEECRIVVEKLCAVGVLQGQCGFSDGKSWLVIFFGVGMQALASAQTAKAMQAQREVRMPRWKFGFTHLQGLLDEGVCFFESKLFPSNVAQTIGGENGIQTRASAELVVNPHGLRQARISFRQAELREIKQAEI